MLNLLTKTKPWMLASLLVATSVFGQNKAACPKPPACPPKPCAKPCPQPCPPTQMCEQDPCCPAWPTPVLNAAYNYPARMQTRCPWDVYAMASFIYWQPMQENMELGFVHDVTAADVVAGTYFMSGNFVNQDFDYKPGFKVGIGMNFDHDGWDSTLVYTWFHGTQSQSAATTAAQQLIRPLHTHPRSINASVFDSASQKWRLNMDLLDLDLGRWYYVGTQFTMRPAFGLRGAWIRQKYNSTFGASAAAQETAGSLTTVQRSNSWAVGPMASLKTNWTIGEGFRIIGNGAADILYTRYTKLRETSQFATNAATPVVSNGMTATQKKLGYLRTHLELELGFGWGTYLDCNNWYMDFAATYGFQVFYNQNMFRQYLENNAAATSAVSYVPNGDLFVHGLNLTFGLSF